MARGRSGGGGHEPRDAGNLARAVKLRELLAAGLPIKVSIASFGSGIGTVEVASGGTRYRFTPQDNKPRPLIWSATGSLPEASVVLYGAGAAPATANADAAPGVEALRVETEGPWALFRLMDRADKQNAGAQAIRAAFGEGAQRTVLKVELPGTTNPFSRAASGPSAARPACEGRAMTSGCSVSCPRMATSSRAAVPQRNAPASTHG